MAKNPVNRETIKKLLDTLTPMKPESAEKFLQDILRLADERRRDVERVVGDVAKAGVRTAEGLTSSVQNEMSRQMTKMAGRIDDLEKQVDSLGKALESARINLLALASHSGGESDDENDEVPRKSKKGKKKSDKKAEKKASKDNRGEKGGEVDLGSSVDSVGSAASTSDGSSQDSNPAVAGV